MCTNGAEPAGNGLTNPVKVVVEEGARVGEVCGLTAGDDECARVHLPLVVSVDLEDIGKSIRCEQRCEHKMSQRNVPRGAIWAHLPRNLAPPSILVHTAPSPCRCPRWKGPSYSSISKMEFIRP